MRANCTSSHILHHQHLKLIFKPVSPYNVLEEAQIVHFVKFQLPSTLFNILCDEIGKTHIALLQTEDNGCLRGTPCAPV